ncbi:MAG: thiol-activated cytolysin family protein [Cyclobacteriaceae bacterium]|nr:thiol-activated cytolysin family protein [Cyclobacteriaceae bacterium]
MKNWIQTKCKESGILMALIIMFSCNPGETPEPITFSPDAEGIGNYLNNMADDVENLLNVQNISGSSQRTLSGTNTNSSNFNGGITVCKTQSYNLKNNFENVAILRPTNGIIYPGAIVIADKATLGGLPTPTGIERAPVSLRLDLPGIGEKGNILVEKPSNTSVKAKIDEALEWWNANSYQDGYVNASNSSYTASTSYSYRQLSMDVGLNVEWATGDVAAQFNYTSTKTQRVAMMVFKQVFYTITMDPPSNPGIVFGPNVSLTDVEKTFNSNSPPAYVQSVSYGRIIMFRMITTSSATDIELEATLKYATGLTTATGNIETKYKQVLQNSNINVITIGGNASVASRAVEEKTIEGFNSIITGDNAVYSRENPGVPISYKLHYLKDNTTAKLGYTTEYQIESCEENLHPAREVSLNNKNGLLGPTMRFTITYKVSEKGKEVSKSIGSGEIRTNTKTVKTIPAGAYGIRLTTEYKDGFVWKFLGDRTFSRPTKVCMESNATLTQVTLKYISC